MKNGTDKELQATLLEAGFPRGVLLAEILGWVNLYTHKFIIQKFQIGYL